MVCKRREFACPLNRVLHSSGCAAVAGFKQKSPSLVSEMPHGFLELLTTNDVADAGEISAA